MPLRVNMAGVIPVIFAAAVMAFPPTIGQFFPQTQGSINPHFSPSSWTYLLLEGALIIIFTYFYTAVQFNPVDQADNLRKYGGYIPGIRPGPPTAQYLDRVLTRLTLPGSLYLAAIAVLPSHLHPLRRLLAGDLARARRHLGADRRRRRARHDAPDGVADDDALLRGLPEVHVNLLILGPQGAGQGNAGASASPPNTAIPHVSTGDMFRAAIARADRARPAGRADPRPRRARPRRADGRADPRAARQPTTPRRLRPRRLPAQRSRRPRRSTRCSTRSAATSTRSSASTSATTSAPSGCSGAPQRRGPRRRHARRDRDAGSRSTTRRPSRSSSTTARTASSCRSTPSATIDEVYAEIQAALEQARGARGVIIRKSQREIEHDGARRRASSPARSR